MLKVELLLSHELLDLIFHYDWYIQDANTKDLYESGWRPVCIEEFLNAEYREILDVNCKTLHQDHEAQ